MNILLVFFITLPSIWASQKVDWQQHLQYIPTRTDVFLSIDLAALRLFLIKNGLSEDELLKTVFGAGKKNPLQNTMYQSFLKNLKKIVLAADAEEFKKKKPKQFLILVEGPEMIVDLQKTLQTVKQEIFMDHTLYEIDAADKAYFCRINGLYLIGYLEYIQEYISSKKAKKTTLSPHLAEIVGDKKTSHAFLYVPLARLLEKKLQRTIAMGQGLGGSGFNENVFVRSLINLQHVTAEVEFNEKLSFSLSMHGKDNSDSRNLTMFNHFLIVGTSLAIPSANRLSRSVTKKDLKINSQSLKRFQQIIGRIRTEEVKNGTRVSFTLTEKETSEFLIQIKAGLKKSLAAKQKTKFQKKDLFDSLRKNDLKMLSEKIIEKSDASSRNRAGETLLYKAVELGNMPAVKLLILKGAGINDRNDNNKRTPMHSAADGKSEAITTFLIEKGANVNTRDTYGYYPIHLAVKNGSLHMVKLILAGGGRVNVKTLDGETPLHVAAGMGNVPMIRLLIEAGANKNSRDFYGDTPLGRANKGNHADAARELE